MSTNKGELVTRYLLGTVGVGVLAYGSVRIIQQQRSALPAIAKWLIGGVIVHDGIIAPVTIGIGWLIARYVPPKSRAHVQGGLITTALVGSVAIFLIRRQHKYGAKSLALLQQNYLANTAILIGVIVAGTLVAYLVSTYVTGRPARARTNRTNSLPPADH